MREAKKLPPHGAWVIEAIQPIVFAPRVALIHSPSHILDNCQTVFLYSRMNGLKYIHQVPRTKHGLYVRQYYIFFALMESKEIISFHAFFKGRYLKDVLRCHFNRCQLLLTKRCLR